MERVEKTVFLSYRRTNIPWALAIFQNLTQNGYDVFMDYSGIASGDFERVILGNITARAHFLVLLTPSALERCDDPGDWLRREIETALDNQRNIIPLMLEGFDFGTPKIANQLTGNLAALKHYNGLSIPPEYFMEAMGRLRDRFLNVPLTAVLHPASLPALRAAEEQKAAADAAPEVKEKELTAQQWYERGNAATDVSEKLRFYDEAIRLDPRLDLAYNNRAETRRTSGDAEGALEDCDVAIQLNPELAVAYSNRGLARLDKGDTEGALLDFSEAIRLRPDLALAYSNRGEARRASGDWEGAVRDCTEAIQLNPALALAYNNRGLARYDGGDPEGALRDYADAMRLNPNLALAYNNRGFIRHDRGDFEGAVGDYAEAIRFDPTLALAYNNRALARYDKGDIDGALHDWDAAIRLRPKMALFYYNRSFARRAKGDAEGAQRDYNEAVRLGYQPKR
jgi:tetratricopeptide (TPR) repeat protein